MESALLNIATGSFIPKGCVCLCYIVLTSIELLSIQRFFSLPKRPNLNFAHRRTYSTGTGGYFPVVKRLGVKVISHHHIVTRISGGLTPPPIFLQGVYGDNFIFTLSLDGSISI
jgi:hypothetical protein